MINLAARNSRGTVTLVALCFVAVLGIVLGSYLTICSRTMNLSNRSFQSSLSQQLAEFGMEEGLRAFNKGDWSNWSSSPTNVSSGAWTLDTTNKRATRTITFAAGKLAQGATATVKIRIENYDANVLGETWNSTKTYTVGDLVGDSGVWYRCVSGNSNNEPTLSPGNLSYWVPEPIPWAWGSNKNYKQNADVVCYYGTWYQCILTHTSSATINPSNTTYWSSWRPAPQLVMQYPGYYAQNQYAYRTSNDTWYRCTGDHWSSSFPAGNWVAVSGSASAVPYISWAYRTTATYSYNDVVYYNQTWYRFIYPDPANGVTPGSNAAYWENALSGGTHGWVSACTYNLGDVVYYSSTSQWYRCIKAHPSGTITPTNTTYWSNTPAYSALWASGEQYAQNDTVRYQGTWYRCSTAHTSSSSITPTNTTYWISANSSTYAWSATSAYAVGAYRCYSGVWYKCTTANTGQSPNNTNYWTPTWLNSSGVTTGAPIVYAEATISLPNNPGGRTQLRAIINPGSLFPNAVGTTGTLTISTGTGSVDSYDSTAAAYGGSNVGSSAVLAAGSTLTISGTTAIKGYLAWPSPPSGISSGTTINGVAFTDDKTRVSRSPYVPKFDSLPANSLSTAFSLSDFPKGTQITDSSTTTGNTLNLGTPGGAAPSRYYYDASLNLRDSSSFVTLNVNGPVILYVNGNLRTRSGSPDGVLNITSTGSAEIHVDGGIRADASSGGFNNFTTDPKRLILISDIATTTTQQLAATTSAFYGVVYAPKTTYTTGLTIATGVQIYGALSASEVTFSSEATVHYDTSLRYAAISGVDQPYIVTEWRELPIAEQATMP